MSDPVCDVDPAEPPVRRRVVHKRAAPVPAARLDSRLMELLAAADRPLSAYDLAASLREEGQGAAVVSVYRGLDRLVARRLVQKVETLSAYRLRDGHDGILLICDGCGRTAFVAAPDEHHALLRAARGAGFAPSGMALEASGRCASCRGAAAGPLP